MIRPDADCCGSFGSTDTRVATPPSLTCCARFVQRRCLPSRSVSRRRQAIKRRSRFVLHQDMQTVLRCQMAAFNAIGGIPSEILYDRMKTAVIGEAGGSIVYNRALIDFARHYGFQPKACRPYRAKTKGKALLRRQTIIVVTAFPMAATGCAHAIKDARRDALFEYTSISVLPRNPPPSSEGIALLPEQGCSELAGAGGPAGRG